MSRDILTNFFQALLFPQEMEHALYHFRCKQPPSTMLCALLRNFKELYLNFPELEELILYQYEECSEQCEYVVPMEQAIPILMYGITEYGSILPCNLVYFIHTFHFIEGRYPTEHEIDTELAQTSSHHHMNQMMSDHVDEFWKNSKSNVDLSNYKPTVLTEKHTAPCTICQEDMNPGQSVITLPCAHTFHCHSEHCEGIEPWLSKIDSCPLCKKKVE